MKKIFVVVLAIILINCSEEETTSRPYPRVRTHEVSGIDSTHATLSGEITFASTGISDHGFYWSESRSIPPAGGTKISLGTRAGKGTYTATIDGNLKEDQVYYVSAFAQSDDHLVFGELVEFKSLGTKAPRLVSISPGQAHWGDTITMRGKNFARVVSAPTVTFGSHAATIVSRNDTLMKVIVPDALLDKQSQVAVTVSGNSSVFENQFELLGHDVTSYSPIRGRAGDQVTIAGNHFNLSRTRVFFGTKEAQIMNATRSQIQCSVPAGAEGGTINMEVRTSEEFSVINSFFNERPIIATVSPINATFEDEITITGEYFSATGNEVRFGSHFAEITFSSETEIRAKVPTTLTTRYHDIVVTSGQEETSFNSQFGLLPPVITSISPSKVWPEQFFTIKGSNFNPTGSNMVTLGNQVAWSNTVDANTIEVYLPAVSSLTLGLSVTTAGMTVSSVAQSSWAKLAANAPHSYWFWQLVHDGILYAGAGNNAGDTEVWKYNPSTETWTQLQNYPGAYRSDPFSFTIGDKGYVGTGYGEEGWKNELWEYDFATDQWKEKNQTSIVTAVSLTDPPQGFSYGGKGYVLIMDKLWQYDPSTDSWTQKASFPKFFWGQPWGFTYNDYIYAFSPAENENEKASLYRYDLAANTWEYVTAAPFDYFIFMFFLKFDNGIYLSDGYDEQPSFYKFDPTTETFETLLPYPGGYRLSPISFVTDGTGYLIGGSGFRDGWKFVP